MRREYKIKGMHCRSCEVLIEQEVRKISGVKKAVASNKKGLLTVLSDGDYATDVAKAVSVLGYEIGGEDLPLINKTPGYFLELTLGFLILLGFYLLFKDMAPENLLNPAAFTGKSFSALFILGLIAGVSSCMALVGGLVLGISARFAEKHPNTTTAQKFRPHLFFTVGRLSSFFVLGGLLGQLGGFIRLNNVWVGIMTLFVGVVMLLLGLQLTEISPRLGSVALPKFFTKFLEGKKKEYSHRNAMWMGALTFLLPCGFTQSAQVLAISSGSFMSGALIMLFFALGTTPGLLGIGGLTSVIKKGDFSSFIFKTIGLLIVALSFYNFGNGLSLMGLRIQKSQKKTGQVEGPQKSTAPIQAVEKDGVQLIKAVYDPKSSGEQYVIDPGTFTVKVGKPVRFEILAKKNGLGCMGSVTLPGLLNSFEVFEEGKTAVFEFTPKKTGTYSITCAMGIESGTINVVE